MNCCPHCQGADRFFNQRLAAADLRAYHRHGAGGTTKQLVDDLKAAGVSGMSLLDVGGGIGVIQHELHAAGVSHVTGVDASSSYLALARQEAERQGYAAAARYFHGDFVALAGDIDPADIVTLDRVVCCYPDMEALVNAAAGHAKRLLGLVYPRDKWWTKLGVAAINGFNALGDNPFRTFVHPTAAVERIAAAHAWRKVTHHNGLVWQVVLFAR